MKDSNSCLTKKILIAILLLANLGLNTSAFCAKDKNVDELQSEIDAIDIKLNFLKIKVDDQKKKSRSFEKRIENAKQQVKELGAQIEQLNKNQAEIIAQIQRLEKDNSESREQLKELMNRYKNRLVQLHKIKQGTLVSSVLFAKDLNSFLNRYQMVKYLLEADKSMIEDLKAKDEKVKRISLRLRDKNNALESGKLEIAEKQKKYAKEQVYLKEMLNAVLLNKKEYLKQENALAASRKQLNKQLQEIAKVISKPEFEKELDTTSDSVAVSGKGLKSVSAVPADASNSSRNDNESIGNDAKASNQQESLSDSSPEAAKVMNFIWPIAKDLREQVYEKGDDNSNALLIKPVADADIVAVAKGKVLYKGFLSELGNLVILGHQKGFSSVYAKLDDVDVGINEVVEKGDVIGKIDGGGVNGILHFEIRFCGKKLPPLPYLPQ